jgi:signal transduction histidine kinase
VTEGRLPALPAGLQLTVYRLVQEALTNTLKHAVDAQSATVRLRFADNRLEVEIVDDGAVSAPPLIGAAGHGINGMRERASMYGGKVEAGPRVGRGWRVDGLFDLGTTAS